jgi:hypothetical protein
MIPASERAKTVHAFFFNLHSGGGIKVHSTLRPLNGLLCQPRVNMIMVKSVEWLAGETEVLGENLPSAALSTTNPTCCPYANPGRRGGKPASNRCATAWPLSSCLRPLGYRDRQTKYNTDVLKNIYILSHLSRFHTLKIFKVYNNNAPKILEFVWR